MIWDSFFDDDQETYKGYMIWKKISIDQHIIIDQSDVLFEGYLNKFDNKSNSLKERFFILTKRCLYYKKVITIHSRI